MSKFIELTNASGRKLDTIYIKKDAICMLEKPENTEVVGCIVCVMAQVIPVKESYEQVKSMLA